jgi:hypothetical protein
VATHSPDLVDKPDPADLLLLNLNEDGFTGIKRCSDIDLAGWLEDYSLGNLWKMNVLNEQFGRFYTKCDFKKLILCNYNDLS